MVAVIVIIVVLVVLGIGFAVSYNGLVGRRNRSTMPGARSTCSSSAGTTSSPTWSNRSRTTCPTSRRPSPTSPRRAPRPSTPAPGAAGPGGGREHAHAEPEVAVRGGGELPGPEGQSERHEPPGRAHRDRRTRSPSRGSSTTTACSPITTRCSSSRPTSWPACSTSPAASSSPCPRATGPCRRSDLRVRALHVRADRPQPPAPRGCSWARRGPACLLGYVIGFAGSAAAAAAWVCWGCSAWWPSSGVWWATTPATAWCWPSAARAA